MIYGAIFWTEQSGFGKVREMLTNELHLVPPNLNVHELTVDVSLESCKEDWLIYEDPILVSGKYNGVYRVNFSDTHKNGSHIGFRYFIRRMNERIRNEDPMRVALLKTYEILKPVKVTDWGFKTLDLESLVSP